MRLDLDFGFDQIAKELIRGIIDAVADKPYPSLERKIAAQQTVACTVMAYQPRDPVEIMMAGHCIVYDRMLCDGAGDMLRGQAEDVKIRARPGILATGKMFLATMAMLNRMQARPETGLAFARQQPTAAERPEAAPPAEKNAGRRRETGLSNQPAEPPAAPDGHATPASHAEDANSAPPAEMTASGQVPAAQAPAENESGHDQPVAALAEMFAPGQIEALFLKGLTPEEKEHVQKVFARTGQSTD